MSSGMLLILSAATDGRVFGLDQQMMISVAAQLINFIILAVVLAKILYKPVHKFMQDRTDRISGQFRTAEEDMAKANELKTQYEKMITGIRQERDEILENGQQIALEKSKLILEEATTEADNVRQRALTDIQRENDRVKEELKQYIIEVAAVMAEKIVVHAIDRDTQERLFDETMAELEEIAWQN